MALFGTFSPLLRPYLPLKNDLFLTPFLKWANISAFFSTLFSHPHPLTLLPLPRAHPHPHPPHHHPPSINLFTPLNDIFAHEMCHVLGDIFAHELFTFWVTFRGDKSVHGS